MAQPNMLAQWEPQLHPRDEHGRFRNTWRLSDAAKALVTKILKAFHPATFRSDAHAQAYLDTQAHKKKRSHSQMASIDYFMTEAGNADIQAALRANHEDMPQIRELDGMMAPLEHDVLATRVLGPDAFGLPPERMGEIEEWTGKLLMDRGYAPVNLGTPHAVEGPHVTMSIIVPRGTPAVIPGESRSIILDREQPLRIMKVTPDGHGGVYVYAIVAPKQGNKEAPRGLGKELMPGEKSPAIEPTPEELAKRGLPAEHPQGPNPKAAPGTPQAPAPVPQPAPGAPPGPEAPNPEAPNPAAPQAPEAPAEPVKPVEKIPHPDQVEKPVEPKAERDRAGKRAAAEAAHQQAARADVSASAAAEVDELLHKKADNKVIAAHLRGIASGPKMEQIRDPEERAKIEGVLEYAAVRFDRGDVMGAKGAIRSLAREHGVQMQHKAGDVIPFHEGHHDAVNPEGMKAGEPVHVIRPGAEFKRDDGKIVQLDRPLVRRAEAPKKAEPKAPDAAGEARRARLRDLRERAIADLKDQGFDNPRPEMVEEHMHGLARNDQQAQDRARGGAPVAKAAGPRHAAPSSAPAKAAPAKAAPAKAAAPVKKAAPVVAGEDLNKRVLGGPGGLRQLAKDRGIKIPAGARKADIVKLLGGEPPATPVKKAVKAAAVAKVAAPGEAKPLEKMLVKDLRAMAAERGVRIPAGARKADIVKLLANQPEKKAEPPIPSFGSSASNVRVPGGRIRVSRHQLRAGDEIEIEGHNREGWLIRTVKSANGNDVVLDDGKHVLMLDRVFLLSRRKGIKPPPKPFDRWTIGHEKLAKVQEVAEAHGIPIKGRRKADIVKDLIAQVVAQEDIARAENGDVPEAGDLNRLSQEDLKQLFREAGEDVPFQAGLGRKELIKAAMNLDIGAPLEQQDMKRLLRIAQEAGIRVPKDVKHDELVALIRNPPKLEWHHEITRGIRKLIEEVASGIKKRNSIGEGAMGETSKVEFSSGGEAIEKIHKQTWGIPAVQQADAEQLASVLGHALDSPNPHVYRQDHKTIFMQFVVGQTAARAGHEKSEKAATTPEARRIGLLDLLTGNVDRHQGNWMVTPAGKPVPIDHGLAWNIDPNDGGPNRDAEGEILPEPGVRGPFTQYWMEGGRWKPFNDGSKSELMKTRARVEALRPQFELLGRGEWLDLALERLDAIIKRALNP